MEKIRVLIVDDSVVIRRILSDALSADPLIEIVGVAANGKIALQKIPQVNPDILTLDIEMPEMDGLATLKELRTTYKTLPVIMFSTLTERGAEATLDALALGASDYVTKPANVGKVSLAQERLRTDLIPKIKNLVPRAAAALASARELKPVTTVRTETPSWTPVPIDAIVIGVSTGGPNALTEVIPSLPGDLPVPVLIVQHMPPVFTKNLADRLNEKSALTVQEGYPGAVVESGQVWIAPGQFHMVLERHGTDVRIQTNEDPPENSCRPAVDVLFRSAEAVYGGNAMVVMLTGMGHDGCRGTERLFEAGALVLAQDEASSVVWGMPGAVVEHGLAHEVMPLDRVAEAITSHAMAHARHAAPSAGGALS